MGRILPHPMAALKRDGSFGYLHFCAWSTAGARSCWRCPQRFGVFGDATPIREAWHLVPPDLIPTLPKKKNAAEEP